MHTHSQATDSFEYYATEHFRLSGVYWGATALYLMGRLDALDGTSIVSWVMACQHSCGGFGGSERHDPHLLYTLSAVQLLALYDRMDLLDKQHVAQCMWDAGMWHVVKHIYTCVCILSHNADVASLQQPDGSFTGDQWGEVDTRCVHGVGMPWCDDDHGDVSNHPSIPTPEHPHMRIST